MKKAPKQRLIHSISQSKPKAYKITFYEMVDYCKIQRDKEQKYTLKWYMWDKVWKSFKALKRK